MPEIVYREARPEDVPQIFELIQLLAEYERLSHLVSGTAEELHRWLFEEPTVYCWVAEEEGRLLGYSLFFHTFSTFLVKPGVWLEDIFVLPSERGRGIGTELIRRIVEYAKQKGYGRVEWSVLDWNVSAIGFYEKIGATVMPDWRICRIVIEI